MNAFATIAAVTTREDRSDAHVRAERRDERRDERA
jgi:hypothetical protein